MKPALFSTCAVVFLLFQLPVWAATDIQEKRGEADQYYQQGNFKKAHKVYYKLAKAGDRYSQSMVSQMYAEGEGKKVDLTEAYAWSVLAAESGKAGQLERSEALLELTDDKKEARDKAVKLQKKYGRKALQEKELKRAEAATGRSGSCMGSNLACSR